MAAPEAPRGKRWRGLAMVMAVLGLGLSGVWAAANGQAAAPGWWPGGSQLTLDYNCSPERLATLAPLLTAPPAPEKKEEWCSWYDQGYESRTPTNPRNDLSIRGLRATVTIVREQGADRIVVSIEASARAKGWASPVYGQAWDEIGCDGAEGIFRDMIATAGLTASYHMAALTCEPYGGPTGGINAYLARPTEVKGITLVAPLKVAPPARAPAAAKSCDPSQLAGKWTNKGKEYAGWGVSLTVTAANGGARGEFGRTKRRAVTDNRIDWPVPMLKSFSIGGAPVTPTADGKCRFRASGYSGNDGSSFPWSGTITYDSRRDSLSVEGQESTAWTRGGPQPVVAQICKRADIEGAWYRNDGSALRISATNLDSGGVGLFFVHPQGWPRGVLKYSRIRQDGDSCTFQAVCVEIQRESGDADYRVLEPTCTLTLDPVKGVLSQGGRWTYGRTESNSEEAAARRRDEAVQSALSTPAKAPTAETDRLQREYEAKKKADEAAYARAQAEYERQKAEAEAKRQRELREWEAKVRACQAGDKSQC